MRGLFLGPIIIFLDKMHLHPMNFEVITLKPPFTLSLADLLLNL